MEFSMGVSLVEFTILGYSYRKGGSNMYDKPACYEGTEPYIFVSYSHKDSAVVYPLIQAMNDHGLRVWYDSGIEISSSFWDVIAGHIQKSHGVIAFLSNNYTNSRNCTDELFFALDACANIMPVYLKETDMSPGLKLKLASLQALFYHRIGDMNMLIQELIRAEITKPCLGAVNPLNNLQLSVEADYLRGMQYFSGNDVPQDFHEAFQYFHRAAQAGHAGAQYWTANCYFDGKGVQKSYVNAAIWFIKAAEQSHPSALHNLGFMYWKGLGVPKDINMAVALFKKSASLGNGAAKWHLEHCKELSEQD